MNPKILKILDEKVKTIVYFAQHLPNCQLIRAVVQENQTINSKDQEAIIKHIQSMLSSTTKVSVDTHNPPNISIFIEVPPGENLEPLHTLRQQFKKTP